MDGSLGSLIVSIGSDMKGLQAGLATATKSIQGYAQTAGKFIETHRRDFLIAGAAITGALTLMTKAGVAYGTRLDKLTKTMSVTTEEFSRLAYAADQEHGSLQALEKGLINLTIRIGYAADGLATYTRAFEGLGISYKRADGTLKSAYEVFLDLSDAASAGEMSTKQLSDMIMLLGVKAGKDLIPLLKLGREGMEELGDEAKRSGLVMDSVAAAQLKDFDDSVAALKGGMMGLNIVVAQALTPALKVFVEALTKLEMGVLRLDPFIRTLTINFIALSGILLTLLGVLGFLLPVLKSMNTMMLAMTSSTVGLGLALKGLGGVGAAAFIGWGVGRLIGEVTGLDKALSGENGLFTNMFKQIDDNWERYQKFMGLLLKASTGIDVDFTAKPGAVDLGAIDVNEPGGDDGEAAKKQQLEAAWSGYEEFYKEMKAGLQVIDSETEIAGMMQFRQDIEERMQLVQTYNNLWMQAHQGMHSFANMFIQNFHAGFSNALSAVIMGTMKAKEAFKAFGQQIIKSIVDYLAQQAVAWVITKTLHTVMMGVQAGMAQTAAAMWAPAAALASLASFGGNSAPAMAGIAQTVGFAQAMAVPALAAGGNIVGSGSVIVGENGPEILSLNAGARVTPLNKAGEININFYGDINTPLDVEEMKADIGLSINNISKAR